MHASIDDLDTHITAAEKCPFQRSWQLNLQIFAIEPLNSKSCRKAQHWNLEFTVVCIQGKNRLQYLSTELSIEIETDEFASFK